MKEPALMLVFAGGFVILLSLASTLFIALSMLAFALQWWGLIR